ncbi:MAG: hypothetical protein HY769_03080 [Candidatus Stahlbacteria bacterium]|nr:hypothetical protein [Candidatus Stahlbacteria bacterium]
MIRFWYRVQDVRFLTNALCRRVHELCRRVYELCRCVHKLCRRVYELSILLDFDPITLGLAE